MPPRSQVRAAEPKAQKNGDQGLGRSGGWLLLPLRAFLGTTFCYAGLQKLANHTYLDPRSPASVQAQMNAFRHTSPLGPILGLTAEHATSVGLLIAFGELVVGLGILLGLWTRAAAAAGMLLSLSFLLTVSWNTTPYYYGSDIVFLFALTPFVFPGGHGLLTLDAAIVNLARRDLGLAPVPAGGIAPPVPARLRRELDRRMLLRRGAVTAAVGVGAAVLGGVTAVLGRFIGGTSSPSPRTAAGPLAPSAGTPPTSGSSPAAGSVQGTPVAQASRIPVGHALQFTDPNSGQPAWLIHESPQTFRAFSAVCTHAGCTVDFDRQGKQFACPCHGATFDAANGQVTAGPAATSLQLIPVSNDGGELRV